MNRRLHRHACFAVALLGCVAFACASEPALRQNSEGTAEAKQPLDSEPAGKALDPDTTYEAATNAFFAGRVDASLVHFDALYAMMSKSSQGQLWQRGIALYYAGRYEECVEQFVQHRTVNPHDVENSVWHYLCNVPLIGKAQAQAAFFPARDGRVPMMDVHALYAGTQTEAQVLKRARAESTATGAQRVSLFYAHLYLALWYEAEDDRAAVRKHLALALEGPPVGHYMYEVAEMHQKWLETKKTPAKK